ncbi:MAG: PEP-CTERM sorting domain-containing protein [Tepidisphaeraceae bacterium]
MHSHGITGIARRRLVGAAPLATVLAVAGPFARTALAQMVAGNIATEIRPLVWVQDTSQTPAAANNTTAVGLLDTGAFGGVFVPPPTNSLWGITTTVAGSNSRNYGIVGAPTNFAVGGIMGGAFSGPEVGAPPTHTFTSINNVGHSTSYTSAGNISPSLTYYNGVKSFVNIGAGWYDGPTGGTPLEIEVDPTNASWMPFAFNNIAAGATNSAGKALSGPTIALDQATSSVSFYFVGDPQAPTPTANADPGFLTVLQLTPSGGAATFAGYAGTNGATVGSRPTYIAPPGNPLGLPAATYVVDTGAPLTYAAGALYPAGAFGPNSPASPPLLGTNVLNQYGQYFDLKDNALLLFAPQSKTDQNIVGPGILFDVGRKSTGLANTGVNQLATNGSLPVNTGNGYSIAGDGVTGQQSSAVFSTQLTHSNKAYISGISALGLQANDQLNGLSMGADQIGTPQSIANGGGSDNCALLFSVDSGTQGLPNTGVAAQVALGKQSTNMYISTTGSYLANQVGANSLKYSGDLLGLGPDAGPSASAAGRGHVDQLGDFVLESQRGYYNSSTYVPGSNSGGSSTVQRNIDPTITSETSRPLITGLGVTLPSATQTPGPGTNPPSIAGTPVTSTPPSSSYRQDDYGSTFDTYFTLDNSSPTIANTVYSSADILVNNSAPAVGASTGFHLFADNTEMGLSAGDCIDALALSRPMLGAANPLVSGTANRQNPYLMGNFDANKYGDFLDVNAFNGGTATDYDLFTLARGSPDLNIFDPVIGRTLSPADVFVSDFDGTFSLYATAQSLGLNPATDEITGLKPLPLSDVPEPATFALLAVGAAMLLSRRSRR